MQALPFSDALKLLSYLKEWTSYSDKVTCPFKTSLFFKMLLYFSYNSNNNNNNSNNSNNNNNNYNNYYNTNTNTNTNNSWFMKICLKS